jgi:hypothetical protein
MHRRYVIGVHIRGTDALKDPETPYRHGSLNLTRYVAEIERLIKSRRAAMIFVASDEQSSVDAMKDAFGARVLSYSSILHTDGGAVGAGPTGCIMPGYIAGDRDLAARNGEEAVIDYLLLSRCNYLVHNGSSLARMVLLNDPDLDHCNIYPREMPPDPPSTRRSESRLRRRVRQMWSPLFHAEVFKVRRFPPNLSGWHCNGNVEIVPGSGAVRVTLSDTLFRSVPIDGSVRYRYSLEACSPVPGALLRLQINWHDNAGRFLEAAIALRRSDRSWSVYEEDMTPPPGAATGVVIVGAHTAMPVLVRSVSLSHPRRRGSY